MVYRVADPERALPVLFVPGPAGESAVPGPGRRPARRRANGAPRPALPEGAQEDVPVALGLHTATAGPRRSFTLTWRSGGGTAPV